MSGALSGALEERADLESGSAVARPALANETAWPSAVLRLHRVIGNRAVGRLISRRRELQRQQAGTTPIAAERELDARWHIDQSTVSQDLVGRLIAKPGLAVAFYEAYETGSVNDAEFKSAGNDFAKTYGTLAVIPGKDSATLTESAAVPIKNRDDLAQALASIRQTLFAFAYRRAHEQDCPEPVTGPMIETVAIFSHGVRTSLGLDPGGETGAHWFGQSQIPAFAAAIKPYVSPAVRVLLFACSTGASEKESYAMPAPDGAGGKGSFAAQLANALGGSATVYAHDVAAHAESNPYARVFTAGSDTGRDMFNVLYDQAFIDSEVARVKRDKAALVGSISDEKLASGLRSAMWNHYVDAVQSDFVRINTKNRHFNVGGYGGVGAAMFMDPTGTTTILHDDFRSVWLTDERLKALAK